MSQTMPIVFWGINFAAIVINIVFMLYAFKNENRAVKLMPVIGLMALNLLIILDCYYNHANLPPLTYLSTSLLVNMLLITAIIDFMTYYIYNVVFYVYAGLGIAYSLYVGVEPLYIVFGILSGILLYGIIYVLAKRYYGTEAFGLGDVYFLGAIGGFLGVQNTLITGLLAFYIAIFFIALNFLRKRSTGLKTEIPFGPSIAIAAYLMALHLDWIFGAYTRFQNFIDSLL